MEFFMQLSGLQLTYLRNTYAESWRDYFYSDNE